MAKKFRDPYGGDLTFDPIINKLDEIGFFKPRCIADDDAAYRIQTFSDGSNMLFDKVLQIPIALYDALMEEVYSVRVDVNGDLVTLPYSAYLITREEMAERVQKKEFRDEFR